MIAVDTNVLLRYLVPEDPVQSRLARSVIEDAVNRDGAVFIPTVVMCELVWVLDRSLKYKRAQIAHVLEQLITRDSFIFESRTALYCAWEDYRLARGDFADYVIAHVVSLHGCSSVITFDRALTRPPFKLLRPATGS
jgi:predicted nucleic-acid-binding protein